MEKVTPSGEYSKCKRSGEGELEFGKMRIERGRAESEVVTGVKSQVLKTDPACLKKTLFSLGTLWFSS